MSAVYLLAALLACNGCNDKKETDLPADAAKTAEPKGKGGGGGIAVLKDASGVGTQGPAPSRALWGLELGASTGDQVDAWLTAKGLDCPGVEKAEKKQVIHTCRSGVQPEMLGDRTIGGKVDQLVLVQTAGGALEQVTVARSYQAVDGAIADYDATRAAIEKTLGVPSKAKTINGPQDFEGSMARFNALWGFGDLKVTVSASKSVGGKITVSERWQAP